MQADDNLSVASDDLIARSGPASVQKRATRSEEGIIVTYTLISTASTPVTVQFDDALPADYADIGFRPDAGPDWWGDDMGTITVAQTVERDVALQLELGLVMDDPSEFDATTPPEIRSVTPQASGPPEGNGEDSSAEPHRGTAAEAEITERGDSSAEREASDVDGPVDGDPSATRADWDPEDGAAETVTAPSRSAREPTDEPRWDEPSNSPGETGTPSFDGGESVQRATDPSGGEGLAAALVAEIQAGELSDEDVATLQETLRPERSRTEEVRLRHLQSRMDDFAAYLDVFEEFIDERGSFEEFASDIESDIAGIREEVEPVDRTLAEMRDSQSSLRSQVDSLESSMADLSDTVDGLERELDDVCSRHDDALERLKEREETVDTELQAVRDAVDEFETFRDRLVAALGAEGSTEQS